MTAFSLPLSYMFYSFPKRVSRENRLHAHSFLVLTIHHHIGYNQEKHEINESLEMVQDENIDSFLAPTIPLYGQRSIHLEMAFR